MHFWLGTHHPHWLEETSVPLMVSNRRLAPRRSLPRARGPWVLDSGGFSELSMYDGWQTTAKAYVGLVRRYADEIGSLAWAAQQDWMCEPTMLKKTGLSVRTHQAISLANYLEVMDRAPELPWLPVLQGQAPADYLRHYEAYVRAGVPTAPIWGVGGVCRRQSLPEIRYVVRELQAAGLSLHGFGVKTAGLAGLSAYLTSSDSMAWSFHARKAGPCFPGHTHINGANCLEFALDWRQGVLDKLHRPAGPLFERAA